MSFSMLVKPVPELMIRPSASAPCVMAEACNIGLEPLIRSNAPALTRHRLNGQKRTICGLKLSPALMPDWLIAGKRCHWHRYGWRRSGICRWNALCYASQKQSMPDRTANTLVITEGSPVQLLCPDQYSGFHGIVIPGTLRDSIFCAGRSSGTGASG